MTWNIGRPGYTGNDGKLYMIFYIVYMNNISNR